MIEIWSDGEPTQLGLYKCLFSLLLASVQRNQAFLRLSWFWKPFFLEHQRLFGGSAAWAYQDARRSLGLSQELSF